MFLPLFLCCVIALRAFNAFYYPGYPHTQSWAMASVGILNGCFLYSFSCNEVPHAQKFADRERGAF